MTKDFYLGRRLSYDGSLCTVRFHGKLTGTKGEWLGVEWDDVSRGKHHGIHQGQKIFTCRSHSKTAASFIRPTRKPDAERTVLDAIWFKYCSATSNDLDEKNDTIVISGKVAEEVGFEKIAQQQARLADLRIVLLDQLAINGIAPRDADASIVHQAQHELTQVCPNISELDIGLNTIETWQDILDICSALPRLRILRAGGLRFRTLGGHPTAGSPIGIRELDLEDCLLDPNSIAQILSDKNICHDLEELRLSGNELQSLTTSPALPIPSLPRLKSLVLEKNQFLDLDCVDQISSMFPNITSVSLQTNYISKVGQVLSASKQSFPRIDTLNLTDNNIQTYEFLNAVPYLFPNLSSLQLTENPLFRWTDASHSEDPRASEKSYYLTLARIPSLKALNYVKINPRERHEGELYYLSTAEKEINSLFTAKVDVPGFRSEATRIHPMYHLLAKKYDRDSLVESLISSIGVTNKMELGDSMTDPSEAVYPIGSIGARLVKARFYVSSSTSHSQTVDSMGRPVPTATIELPSTLPVKQVMAILVRHPVFRAYLRPLQFDLILESKELDPVDTTTESSTRSAMYGKNLTTEERRDLWKGWGDWDADSLIERASQQAPESSRSDLTSSEEHWTEDGSYCIRDGRKWKRREVNIPHSLKRAWGDWLESSRDLTVRIEPYEASFSNLA